MSNRDQQVSQVLDRIIAQTRAGVVTWQSGLSMNAYNARHGDFVFQLYGGIGWPYIKIARLSGTTVADTSPSAAGIMGGLIDPINTKVKTLYDIVDSRSLDLDELLASL